MQNDRKKLTQPLADGRIPADLTARKIAFGLSQAFGGDWKVEWDDKDDDREGNSTVTWKVDAYRIYLSPMQVPSISGPRTVDGWAVDIEVYFPGSREEPPDSDLRELGIFTSVESAIRAVAISVIDDRLECLIDYSDETVQSEEY